MSNSDAVRFLTVALLLASTCPAWSSERPGGPVPRAEAWLVKSPAEFNLPAPPAHDELADVRATVAKRSAADAERILWWSVGGPSYRWNELAVDAMIEDFVTLPLAARHLALLHAAIDDAVAAAWREKQRHNRARPNASDPSIAVIGPLPKSPSYPSDYAAASAAAAEVLGYIFPQRAGDFASKAEQAIEARLLSGAEYRSDLAVGREIGRRIGALAIAHGKADGSGAKWTGAVPQGNGVWRGTNPIAPMAAKWRPWTLTRQDELRPAAPPAFDSEKTKADLAELKNFKRMPKTNHRAVYWEVFGGARAHALWNQIARTKLLEYADTFDPPASARALATLNIAFLDATIACWDAKYAFWYIRPSQLDPELKPVFPPPNHPSYPAAHGCLSTAAATVLASLFKRDEDTLLAHGKEAAEARIWAGIHYRFDIEAGQEIGRKVAEKALARAFTNLGP